MPSRDCFKYFQTSQAISSRLHCPHRIMFHDLCNEWFTQSAPHARHSLLRVHPTFIMWSEHSTHFVHCLPPPWYVLLIIVIVCVPHIKLPRHPKRHSNQQDGLCTMVVGGGGAWCNVDDNTFYNIVSFAFSDNLDWMLILAAPLGDNIC